MASFFLQLLFDSQINQSNISLLEISLLYTIVPHSSKQLNNCNKTLTEMRPPMETSMYCMIIWNWTKVAQIVPVIKNFGPRFKEYHKW